MRSHRAQAVIVVGLGAGLELEIHGHKRVPLRFGDANFWRQIVRDRERALTIALRWNVRHVRHGES